MALIRAENITKKFYLGDRDITVLNGLTFSIEKGEFVAITGKSGSGKSTLMHILGCLDLPTTGQYFFEDTDISRYDPDQLAHIRNQKIGFVFQRFNLFPNLTALDNVAQPKLYAGASEQQARERAQYLLEQIGLVDRMLHYPYQLSGGEQQRVAIARSIMNNPDMILADEPTGNLDSKTGDIVMQTFMKLNQEQHITLVIITHDFGLAQRAPRIINIADGSIESDSKKIL